MKIFITRRQTLDAKPKICVSPNAKPQRQSVEYRLSWLVLGMYISCFLCRFHLRLVPNANPISSGIWALKRQALQTQRQPWRTKPQPWRTHHQPSCTQREPVEYSLWWVCQSWVCVGHVDFTCSCCLSRFWSRWVPNANAICSGILA